MNLKPPASALDRQGMANLRQLAGTREPEAIRTVARQFESLFLEMMMRSMRGTVPEGGLLDSSQVRGWQSMQDQQLAISLAGDSGLGIVELLERQLTASRDKGTQPFGDDDSTTGSLFPPPREPTGRPSNWTFGDTSRSASVGRLPVRFVEKISLTDGDDSAESAQQPIDRPGPVQRNNLPERFDGTPATFVRTLWHAASEYAPRVGLDPLFVIGQAALETGWGGSLIRHLDGRNSFNLFGIKAGEEWPGDRVLVNTLEYRDGSMRRQREPFRSYESLEAAFADYVRLLRQPRYQDVLDSGADLEAFARGLQSAGYATDPAYAEKIMRVVQQAKDYSPHSPVSEGS